MNITSIAQGRYFRAPTPARLKAWASAKEVRVTTRQRPVEGGTIVEYTASLDGCGGAGDTELEALHLLYYVWRDEHFEEPEP